MKGATARLAAMALGLTLLAIAPSQISNAGQPSPALQQEALTLTDAHGWVPEAALDTAQVEPAPAETDVIEEYDGPAFGESLGQGWKPFDGDIYDAEDVPHTGCFINEGMTSVIACADGYTTLS